jgi:RND superfamily putative drug exporter
VIVPPPHLVIRFRYWIIAVWTTIAALSLPRAWRVGDVLRVEGQAIETESEEVYHLVREAFERPIDQFFAVTIRGAAPVDAPEYQALIDSLSALLAAKPWVSRVLSHRTLREDALVSPDRRTTFVAIALTPEASASAMVYTPDIRATVAKFQSDLRWGSGFELRVTGAPALEYDVRTVSLKDARLGERRSLPLAAAVLILAFGALVAAVLPLVVGVFAIVCALALVYEAAAVHPMSIFVSNIISMIGLGVGIDYSLLVATRFCEELNRGFSAREATARTLDTAGRAVVTSGLTVIVGFLALFLIPVPETRSIAVGGLFVVGAAVLLSVTLLPAGLAVLGREIDRPRWLARKLAWYHGPAAWERWARWLGQHPWRALLIGGAIAAAITWPLGTIKIGLPSSGWFPSGTEAQAGAKMLEEMGAGGAIQPLRIVVRVPEGERVVGTRYLRGLARLSDSIKADPRVARVRSVVDLEDGMSLLQYAVLYSSPATARARYGEFLSAYLSPDERVTLLDVHLADTTSLTAAMDVVRRIRSVARAGVPGLERGNVLVGGFVASAVDLQNQLLERFPLLIAVVVGVTFLMLLLAFRSVMVPLKAVAMNCLSVAGAFGLIVLVFQKGVGAGVFGLEAGTEAIYVLVPVLVFAVVFGLSMDYGVFLLARIKEAFDRTGQNDRATMEGLSATAATITSAAAIMVVVFGTFSFARVLVVQLIGFGLAVAVLLDATLIRMVLVPGLMHLGGEGNWWPSKPAKED